MDIKGKSFFNAIFSLIFILVPVLYFVFSISGSLPINNISYIWLLIFLAGIVYGVLIIKKSNQNNTFKKILGVIMICLSFSSIGLYGFFYFLGKVMG